MTTEQLDIYTQPHVAVDQRRGTPTDRWQVACRNNPGLREAFADTAAQLHAAGQRATANRVAEELRERFRTVGDEYAFNNTWRRPAAEELHRARPDLARDMTLRGGSDR